MSNTSVKVAITLLVLAMPAASFARGGGGGGRGGASAAMGHLGAGQLGAGRPNGAALVQTDPSLNPSQMIGRSSSQIAPPRISVPTIPQFK
jgi:hypothetical protein